MKRRAAVLAVALALGGAASLPSHAAVIGLDFTALGTVTAPSMWSLGFEFTANRNTNVTALGAWDADADGFEQAQQAGLWDCAGNLLSSVFVDNSSPLEGIAGWRFAEIVPVSLTQGGCYRVASQGGEGFAFGVSGVSLAAEISFTIERWTYVGSTANDPLRFPITAGSPGEYGFLGGNFKLTSVGEDEQQGPGEASVPVPGTLALLGLGLLPLGFGRRK